MRVTVEFSGWIEVDQDKTIMEYVGQDDSVSQIITVKEWMKLSKQDRGMYIIENFTDAIKDSMEQEYHDIHMEIEE